MNLKQNLGNNALLPWAARLFLGAVMIINSGCTDAQAPAQSPATAGLVYYQNFCAGCHGKNFDGGTGGALKLPTDFQFGTDTEAMVKTVKEGIPQLGMPAFKSTMTDQQIRSIVAAIKNPQQPSTNSVAAATSASLRDRDKLRTLDYDIRVEVWADKLDIPWAIDFIDAKTALVTERPGPVRIIKDGKLLPEPIKGTPAVLAKGQGGMMDVAVDPEYATNGWIYLAYSDVLEKRSMTKVIRGKLKDGAWVNEEKIWEAAKENYTGSGIHFGCRIVFGPDGKLYFGVGERGAGERSQNLSMPNGKVFRLNRDGSIPEDNPLKDKDDVLPGVFSYGHRNPQGLSFHPITGELWEVEHGPRGGDELNIVSAGQNYGWPLITYGINYNGSIMTKERVRPGLMQPVHVWRPSIAVAGAEFYTGDLFPYWRNHLLVTSLADRDLRLLQIQENRVIHEEIIFDNLARAREAVTGPDGAIYVVLNDPGEIIRLTPINDKPI